MKSLLSILFVVFCVSCNSQSGEYINHEKWQIPGIYDSNPLKGKPKEFTETEYLNLADTIPETMFYDKNLVYFLWRFDTNGNNTFMRTYFDSTNYLDIMINYNEDGCQYESFMIDSSVVKKIETKTKIISKKIASGKYEERNFKGQNLNYIQYTTFLDKGNTVKTEKYRENKFIASKISYYKNDKLMRVDEMNKDDSSSEFYYYSSLGFLDSLVIRFKGNAIRKIDFINNKFGDPVYYQDGNDSGEIQEMCWIKYKYDEKGNWIRKLSRKESKISPNVIIENNKFPNYSLTVRDIKY